MVNISAATREGRLAIFDDVWETIRERYYDPTLRGVDWLKLSARFRPLAAAARDTEEFYRVMRRMIAHLHDSHTRIYAPDERASWRQPFFVSVGVSVRETASALVVIRIERGSEAERAGVRIGDTVVSIDGEAAMSALTRRLVEAAESLDVEVAVAARRPRNTVKLQAAAKLFDGPANSLVTIVFAKPDGRIRSVPVRRERRQRKAEFHVRRVRDGYGVLRFNAFTPEFTTKLVRALKNELRDAPGLVVDLRDNGGGETEAMVDVASVFLPTGQSLGEFADRDGRIRVRPQTRARPLFAVDTGVRFQGPVVLLTSAKTASAAEVFTAAMRRAARAEVVGEHTCGCVLGVYRAHQLPDGGQLDVSELNYHTAGGERLEDLGVAPDEIVTPTLEDFRAARDRTLRRALERLRDSSKDK